MSVEPIFLQEVYEQLGQYPTAKTLPLLQEWGIDYVLVSAVHDNIAFQEGQLPAIKALEGLCYQHTFDDGFMYYDETHVFAVKSHGEQCE
jgi:hypothetical protein